MIKLFSDNVEVPYTTTIFPDGTSQIWKLDDSIMSNENENYILWMFESEAELIHVCQIAQLCYEAFDSSVDLICPYLPYGRQDKDVLNTQSFALTTFKEILYHAGITRIEAFDPHSATDMVYPAKFTTPADFHKYVINKGEHDLICYPDEGAALRYAGKGSLPHVFAKKTRNQLTGEITGLTILTNGQNITGAKVLIIDDICDGGMTFIKVADALQVYKPKQIDLAVSHGLFSKGKDVLHQAGIKNIYTTNSLLRNPDGFKVW